MSNLLQGMDCCSDTAISFHYVSPNMMYVMEYLVYHLRPYGIDTSIRPKAPISQKATNRTSVPWQAGTFHAEHSVLPHSAISDILQWWYTCVLNEQRTVSNVCLTCDNIAFHRHMPSCGCHAACVHNATHSTTALSKWVISDALNCGILWCC